MTATTGPVLTVPDTSPAALAALTAEIAPTAAKYDRSGDIPEAGLRAVQRGGYLTATVSARYGGPQLDHSEVARLLIATGGSALSYHLVWVVTDECVHPPQEDAAVLGAGRSVLRPDA
ncbi:acyl-CoA dehydrogenase family protein [Nocardia sp. NPDC003693]